VLFFVVVFLQDVHLEALAEVVHADEGVDDGEDDEDNSKHGKGRQGPLHGHVVVPEEGLVDADELEEEVAEAGEVEDDGEHHAKLDLAAGKEGGEEENGDGDGDGGRRQDVLGILDVLDDDEELDSEAEEEEEIELEEGDVDLRGALLALTVLWTASSSLSLTYLVVQETLLHAVVSTNLLENVPGKLLVQLPRYEGHEHRGHGDDAGNGHEKGADGGPEIRPVVDTVDNGALTSQDVDGVADLIDLDGRVDEDGQVGEGEADDLNRVLHTQRVPDKYQLVQEGEDEERQEGRDGPVLADRIVVELPNVGLELGEDVSAGRDG